LVQLFSNATPTLSLDMSHLTMPPFMVPILWLLPLLQMGFILRIVIVIVVVVVVLIRIYHDLLFYHMWVLFGRLIYPTIRFWSDNKVPVRFICFFDNLPWLA
jgi:hypothetical protein